MKKIFALGAMVALLAGTAAAQKPVTVGGAPMYPNKNIIENAVNSQDHTTLVAAVKAAGLVDTLQGAGPFTVFAPVNAAFAALPAGTVDTLLKPENKGTLTAVLTYHVVPGRLNSQALKRMIKEQQRQGDAEDRARRRADARWSAATRSPSPTPRVARQRSRSPT